MAQTKKSVPKKNTGSRTSRKKKPARKISPRKVRSLIVRTAIALAVLLAVIYTGYLFLHPLQLKSDSITVQYKTQFNPGSNIRFVFLGSKKNVTVTGDLNTDKIGDYSITYKYKNEKIAVKVKVADTTPPVLLLKNLTTDLQQDITPEMLVYSVEDDSKVTVSFAENTDLNGAGKHTVTVVATDEYGNEARAKTVVKLLEDKTSPVITGADETYTVWQGTTFISDSNVTLSDNLDPNPKLSVDTSSLNMSVPGEYTITYTGEDRSGNTVSAEQKVTVEENPEYGQKIVYLTFEGGPSEHTGEILNILEENGINATFFVSGYNPDFNYWIKEAYDLGNTIGLGSYSCEEDIYSSSTSFWNDLNETASLVKDLTGEDSHLIRFLGGSQNTMADSDLMQTLIEEVNSKGYQYYDWTVDSSDGDGNLIASTDIVSASTSSDAQYITIRMHDSESKQTTVDALQQIIDYYKGQGYQFMPITDHSLASHHATAQDQSTSDDTVTDSETEEETY